MTSSNPIPAYVTDPAADYRDSRLGQRSAGSAADPGPDQRHPPIVPQRLHGALLERPDRRRAGAAAACSSMRRAFRRACQQAVSAIKAPAPKAAPAAKAERRPAKAAQHGGRSGGNGRSGSAGPGREGGPGGVEEGAACGRRPGLRRRLPHPLPRHSAGRRRGHRLPEAQRDDVVGAVPARAERGRGRRCRQEGSTGESTRGCSAGGSACSSARRPGSGSGGCGAGRAAAAAGHAARGNVHPADVLSWRLRPILPRASFRRRPGRVLPALQRGQPVAGLPGGDLRAARRPLRRSHMHNAGGRDGRRGHDD